MPTQTEEAAAVAAPPPVGSGKGKAKSKAAPPALASSAEPPAASAVAPPDALATEVPASEAAEVLAAASPDAAPVGFAEPSPAPAAPTATPVGSTVSYLQALEGWYTAGLEQQVVAPSSLRSYRVALEAFVHEVGGRFVWPEELEDAFDEWVYEAPSLGRSKGRIGHTRAGVRGVATKWRELEGQG